MPKSIPALVSKSLLVWARDQAGFDVAEAAVRARVRDTQLTAWERGETLPTLRQAERIAKLYGVSFSVLCLDEPPKVAPLASEYRRLPGVEPGKESPELRFALRQMLFSREVALRLMAELGTQPPSFDLSVSVRENSETAAERVRAALGISVETQLGWRDDSEAFRAWREGVEGVGALVFLFHKVAFDEARGVSILNLPAPVVGINSKEVQASRPFTLLHELVHLALSGAKEERAAADEHRTAAEWKMLERFVESVVGAVLVPADVIRLQETVKTHARGGDWSVEDIGKLARRFKVTPSALATRLLRLQILSPEKFKRWESLWKAFLDSHPPKPSFGIATPAQKAVGRLGQPFTRLVLGALLQERITSVDASRFLGLNFAHVESMLHDPELLRPPSSHAEAGA